MGSSGEGRVGVSHKGRFNGDVYFRLGEIKRVATLLQREAPLLTRLFGATALRLPPIVGFENFDTKNEFEQLLINFTNESLQDTFNKQVFSNELKLYEDEGIDVVVSSCPDNTACLQMLTSRPKGIIPRCAAQADSP